MQSHATSMKFMEEILRRFPTELITALTTTYFSCITKIYLRGCTNHELCSYQNIMSSLGYYNFLPKTCAMSSIRKQGQGSTGIHKIYHYCTSKFHTFCNISYQQSNCFYLVAKKSSFSFKLIIVNIRTQKSIIGYFISSCPSFIDSIILAFTSSMFKFSFK